ncbi:DUF6504 family protein [Cryptosporangium aurantiacum]|uniref:DUF6504 domain-containing protein n=1 Tax=Cryptosporangium aurantiacum TaxID=134849 RepID=A0A1M7I2N2_9ACTN|nr:DUF6504 family protein [Cryptosporangium aurantiacum]SHM34889.1 hypothetical protein SAMN05443668_101367 [Cryptosporangium aurantiacum]
MTEETEVRRGGGADAPVEFRWNGQIHRVREVLTHHRIRNSPRSAPSTRPDLPPSPAVVDELEARRAARAAGPVGPVEPVAEPPAATRPPDEEIWRVRASPSALQPAPALAGVFDLRFDWAVGRWTVTRIDILEEEL